MTNKFHYFLISFLFLSTYIINAQNSKELLIKSLTDTSLIQRGLIEPDESDFRLDYDDVYEDDKQAKFLQDKGYHGGGPSWVGIVYGAFHLCGNDLITKLDSDVSVTGVSYWSSAKEDLEMIARVIGVIKSDEKILLEVIEIAKQEKMMQ